MNEPIKYVNGESQTRTSYMNNEDYKQLESLLGKLQSDLGHRFALVCSTNDMYTIGIYTIDGDIIEHKTCPTIQETVLKLKTK